MFDSNEGSAGVRVLCVDDHEILVEGLKTQFAIDGSVRVVGRLPTAENLLETIARLRPDVVLLDIEMPGPDVFEVADRLHQSHPRLRFAFLSAHVRESFLAAAYDCGARGYFAKADDLRDIVAGIKELAGGSEGTFVMGPKVRERCGQPVDSLHGSLRDPSRSASQIETRPSTPLDSLTTREMEVLRMIGKGLSRAEIGSQLSRSTKTVDCHQERMMKKLGVSSRADLIRYAIREGLAQA